jgi:DNA-binding SARP family transcriptional activator
MPPVLLLAEVPDPQARARLTTALHLGAPLQISAVLLGQWPGGESLDVDVEGYTDTADTQRLGVLDNTTTVQLLQMLREAHTEAHTAARTAEPGPDPLAAQDRPPQHPQPPPQAPGDQQLAGDAASQLPSPTGDEPDPVAVPDMPQPDPGTAPPAPPPGQPSRRRVPVHVLGAPRILRDGAPVSGLRTRAQELMVYLAVHRNGANLPDIKEAFWPDANNRRAGERLQTETGDLRGRIRDAAGNQKDTKGDRKDPDGGKSIQPVVNTGGRYHLNPDIVEVDWWTVQDALADATAATSTEQRITHLRRAVAAHHGPLAQGCAYDWLPAVEEHVRRQGIIARTQLAELLGDTHPQDAAGLFDDATRLDPYNEDLARRAIRAHARLGDADAIRNLQQRLRTALDEIDVEPDNRTQQLAAQLLREITADASLSLRT